MSGGPAGRDLCLQAAQIRHRAFSDGGVTRVLGAEVRLVRYLARTKPSDNSPPLTPLTSRRKREVHINSVDHYTTNIEDEGDSFKIHFVAHFSSDPNAIPLLLNHGWPGSVLEYIDTIKILRNSTSPAFHVICPDQTGFGWSSGPPLDRGFGMYDMARILDKLMVGLGFGSGYAVQVSGLLELLLSRTALIFGEGRGHWLRHRKDHVSPVRRVQGRQLELSTSPSARLHPLQARLTMVGWHRSPPRHASDRRSDADGD